MLKLVKVMQAKHISQKDLYQRIGLTQASVSLIMSGKQKPKPKNRRLIALAIGWPVDRKDELFEEDCDE